MEFQALLTTMKDCKRCPLRRGCSQVVTGAGNFNAKLMIVGEAPGQDEDIEGEPFVGRRGALLNKLLRENEIQREDIYITNAVKCRPPGNRKPSQTEMKVCKIWLWEEIQGLPNLKVIATLGATSTGLLLRISAPTMKDHVGQVYTVDYTQAKIMPWYHPSFILHRNKPTDSAGAKLITQMASWIRQVKEQL